MKTIISIISIFLFLALAYGLLVECLKGSFGKNEKFLEIIMILGLLFILYLICHFIIL